MLVPTGGDIDASLRSLRIEFNDLDKQTTTTQVDRGKRLIMVRQLLELKNGSGHGPRGADGMRPNGWGEWIRGNLTITEAQANQCVRFAIDPEKAYRQARERQYRTKRSFVGTFNRIRRQWDTYTDAEKGAIAAFIREQALRETGHVVG